MNYWRMYIVMYRENRSGAFKPWMSGRWGNSVIAYETRERARSEVRMLRHEYGNYDFYIQKVGAIS